MKYPLNLSFKLLAIAQQITGTDAAGQVVFYVKQKAFKLKEAVTVFADVEQTKPMYTIKADRVIDFSARYDFSDQNGRSLGAIKRKGMRSIWKAAYEVFDGDQVVFTITEENPWIKVADAVLSELPVVGMLTGHFFHPAYLLQRPDGKDVLRLQKQSAWFEGKFTIEKKGELSDDEETRAMLSLIMLLLLERSKG